MPFINGGYYANRAYGLTLELARIAEELGQGRSPQGTHTAPETDETVIEEVPSLDIKSLLQTAREQDADPPSGFCFLKLDSSPHGVKCEPGKDYHGSAHLNISGIGITSRYVDPRTIHVTAESESAIVSIDSHPVRVIGDSQHWTVDFTIKSGPGFKQQGGAILWTVGYRCTEKDVEMTHRQILYCL